MSGYFSARIAFMDMFERLWTISADYNVFRSESRVFQDTHSIHTDFKGKSSISWEEKQQGLLRRNKPCCFSSQPHLEMLATKGNDAWGKMIGFL